MRYYDVLNDAIDTYGEHNQMIVAIEELSELQKEITKTLRGAMDLEHISEEMADVQIILDQLEIMLANRGHVSKYQNEKTRRLADRIKQTRAGRKHEQDKN